jgi:hypothetical protein
MRLAKRLQQLGQGSGLAQLVYRNPPRLVFGDAFSAEFFETLIEMLREFVENFRLTPRIQPQCGQMWTYIFGPFTHGRLP